MNPPDVAGAIQGERFSRIHKLRQLAPNLVRPRLAGAT